MSAFSGSVLGLGSPVCTSCMTTGRLLFSGWACIRCKSVQLSGSLRAYSKFTQNLIQQRSFMVFQCNTAIPALKNKNPYIITRPFMRVGEPEPNVYYRPWLEGNIGVQGTDWEWDLCRTSLDCLEIYFDKQEHATLFELTWS